MSRGGEQVQALVKLWGVIKKAIMMDKINAILFAMVEISELE